MFQLHDRPCTVPRAEVALGARLAGGTRTSGRLELRFQGQWATVCGDGFGRKDAKVACRMLGFSGLVSSLFAKMAAAMS